jgi:hypothetical protein
MGEAFTTPCKARTQGRNSALAGRDIFVNPYLGVDAEAWFEGYREVPETERGTRPDLMAQARIVRKRKPRGRPIQMSAAGVKALGDRCLPGSTPKPWAVDGAGL